jgi:hypothetical protein
MATADWKQPYNEPDDYGWYLVKADGYDRVFEARFDHPNGCRETGWYVVSDDDSGWRQVKIKAWDDLPSI